MVSFNNVKVFYYVVDDKLYCKKCLCLGVDNHKEYLCFGIDNEIPDKKNLCFCVNLMGNAFVQV